MELMSLMPKVSHDEYDQITTGNADLLKAFTKEGFSKEVLDKLSEYQTYINYHIFCREEDDIVLNSGAYETSLLMSNLFRNTKKQIKMVVGRFSGQVSNHRGYLDELRKCIENGVSIEVILLKSDGLVNSKAMQLLVDEKTNNPNINIRIATKTTESVVKNIFKNFDEPVHFSIFDNDKYRLELSPSNIKGFASFYSPKDTLVLLKDFDQIKTTTTEFKINK